MAGEGAQPDVRVRAARPREGERLRTIAIAAKSHWGYDLERVRAWAAAGDFSSSGLREKELWVVEAAGRAVAWAAIVPRGELMWLDDLWVEPEWIGRGIGSLLFRHVVERARQLGGTRLEWESDPNAVGFYERVGGRVLREGGPSAWGRTIPVMGLDLAGA